MKLIMGAAGQGKTKHMLELAIKLSEEGSLVFISVGDEESLTSVCERLKRMNNGTLDGLRIVICSFDKRMEPMVMGAIRNAGEKGMSSCLFIDGKRLKPEELDELTELEKEHKDFSIYATVQTNRSIQKEITEIEYKGEEK